MPRYAGGIADGMAEWLCDERGSTVMRQKGTSTRRGRLLLSSLFIAAAVTSCAPAHPATIPVASPAVAPASPAVAPASPAPGRSDPAVDAAAQTVETTLRNLVAANSKPDRNVVRSALAGAGIPEANIEVSVSRTPTGLDVDAIEAAAHAGNSCVMGQIRDGGVVVTVLPVLASGKCFVGDAR
ncbi:DUF6993 domain-containing protein [Paenarthrobacter sp. NPDC089675]|uniref:DUF6993 domain-containing protein n=1 Tax=Paenarthrobacter sp. NPDC089675 TaxID=3364376 RepID=UPI00382B0268